MFKLQKNRGYILLTEIKCRKKKHMNIINIILYKIPHFVHLDLLIF